MFQPLRHCYVMMLSCLVSLTMQKKANFRFQGHKYFFTNPRIFKGTECSNHCLLCYDVALSQSCVPNMVTRKSSLHADHARTCTLAKHRTANDNYENQYHHFHLYNDFIQQLGNMTNMTKAKLFEKKTKQLKVKARAGHHNRYGLVKSIVFNIENIDFGHF